ncbi:MAG: hypothetical protein R2770_11990 [Acidimicrobiales bacterium]
MTSAISPALATLPRPGLGASSRSRVAESFGDLMGDVPYWSHHTNVDPSRDQDRPVDRPHAHEAQRSGERTPSSDGRDDNEAKADPDAAEAGEVAASMWSRQDTPAAQDVDAADEPTATASSAAGAEPLDTDVPTSGSAVGVDNAGPVEVGASDVGLDELASVEAKSIGEPIDPDPANPTMALVHRALAEARKAAKGSDASDEPAAAVGGVSSADGEDNNDLAAGDAAAARSEAQQAASTTAIAAGQLLESGPSDPPVATDQSSAADATPGVGAAEAVTTAAGSAINSTDELRTPVSDEAVSDEAVPDEAVATEAVSNEMAGDTAADELASGDGSTETAQLDAAPVTSQAAMDQAAELAADFAAASRPPQSPAHILRSGFELASSGISRSAAMLVERVLDAVDRAASLPPPRAVTLDLEEQHGIKIRVVSEPGGVSVTVDDAGAGTADANRWQRDLSDMLDKRRQNNSAGFESAAVAAGATAGVRAAGPDNSARFMNRSASISSLVAQSTGPGSFDGRL